MVGVVDSMIDHACWCWIAGVGLLVLNVSCQPTRMLLAA